MILTLVRKELVALFVSPLAWILLAVLQLVMAWIFLLRLDAFMELQPRLAQLANAPGATELIVGPLFSAAAMVLMMAVPLLSMRLIAEERRNRTMTLLMSAPLSMTEIVLGKYIGVLLFLLLPAILAAIMGATLSIGTNLDVGLLATNTLGIVLLLATFAAVGLFASSATRHPVVAAVLTLGILLGSWIAGLANSDPSSLMQMISITRRFESFNAGMIDSADLVWHVVVIGAFLALTIRRLDRDRLVGQSL